LVENAQGRFHLHLQVSSLRNSGNRKRKSQSVLQCGIQRESLFKELRNRKQEEILIGTRLEFDCFYSEIFGDNRKSVVFE
jgi:hypothetical protein